MQRAIPICCDGLENNPQTVSPPPPAAGRQRDVAASVNRMCEPKQENKPATTVDTYPNAACSLERIGTANHTQLQVKRQHVPAKSTDSHAASKDQPQSVMLGRQLIGQTVGVPIHVTLRRLSDHMVVMAGSGSGKTVLLRHLIEEAALQTTWLPQRSTSPCVCRTIASRR